jgi:hypothetical protein
LALFSDASFVGIQNKRTMEALTEIAKLGLRDQEMCGEVRIPVDSSREGDV